MAATALFGPGNSTTNALAAASTIVANKPANTADGDLLVTLLYSQFTGGSVTSVPAGWSLVPGSTFPRSGGFYTKPVPSAAAEVGTSYSWTVSGAGRMTAQVFRVTGANLSAPVDASGAVATQGTTSVNLPAVTAVNPNALLIAGAYWNNSTTTASTFTPGGMTDGEQIATPATANTSGTDVAYQQLAAAGTTGSRSFTTNPATATCSGFMFTIAPAIVAAFSGSGALTTTAVPAVAASVALGGTGTLSAAMGLAYTGSAALAGAGSLTVSGAPAASAPVTLSGSGSLTARKYGPLDPWFQTSPLYVAHRGGSADWTEETLYAYTQAAAWANPGTLAFECSVWMTPDGVWVASHDQTTGRVFNGVSYDITTTPWATLAALTSKVGNYPPARLDALLAAFPDRAWFVDNKGSQAVPAFFDMLDAAGGPSRFVAKQYYTGSTIPTEAHNRGYRTWGYYYDADTPNLAATQSRWDLLGMDYTATAASWTAVKSYGKPVLAHIIPTAAGKATATSYGAAGYMASGVQEVVPQTPAALALSGTGTLSAAAVINATGMAALSGNGSLAATTAASATATITLTGSGALTLYGGLTGTGDDFDATLDPRRWAGTLEPRRWEGTLDQL